MIMPVKFTTYSKLGPWEIVEIDVDDGLSVYSSSLIEIGS